MSVHAKQGRKNLMRRVVPAAVLAALIGWRVSAVEPVRQEARITAVTLIHGIPGKEEELKQHLLSLSAPTRAEPGCVTYDLYQSPDKKHEFMRFEVWSSP